VSENLYIPKVRSLSAFKTRERANPDWVIPGLLKRGNTAFIIGAPKRAVKSWLMLAAAWDLSEGLPVWGIKKPNKVRSDGTLVPGEYLFKPSREMRTVYFTQEDTEDDVHDRVSAHFSTGRPENDRVWIVPKNLTIAFDSTAGRNLMAEELQHVRDTAGRIDLVMFDPLRRMMHGDENDSSVIAQIWGVLDRIHQKFGCATMISHHTVKPPTGEARAFYDASDPFTARGSGDIYGGGDAFMTIVPRTLSTEPPARKVEMHFESKRGKPLPPAMLKVHMDTGSVEYLGAAFERQAKDEVEKL